MNKKKLVIITSIFFLGAISFSACKKDSKKDDTEIPPLNNCVLRPTDGIFDDIPNLSFENWYTGKSAGQNSETYYNPCYEDFWATPNQGSGDLGLAKVPVTVFRVSGTDARTGYAAKLVTGLGQLLGKPTVTAATICSGDFKVDIQNPLNTLKFGKPFTRKPKKVSGYYKFTSIESDSASAYCFVTSGSGKNIDTIGFGRKLFYKEDATNTYKKFEYDVVYKEGNLEKPSDRLVIYFSSSEAGDEFKGQPGNTLYIDDVEVEYYN
ncbi:MAG: PCMD domain-containing protein [Chitinophagales bacterium]|nr:PCMD domain-containing protein [Chitinophagales bacterium]